jgi:methionyl-tRNA formyltransferase
MTTTRRIAFIGSKQLGLLVLDELRTVLPGDEFHVVTPDDSRDVRSQATEFAAYCNRHVLPVRTASTPAELHRVMDRIAPDVAFVANWYRKIPAETRSLARLGFYGFHASLLPALRGNAPLVWAILLGLEETGVTLFQLNDSIDAGPTVGQETIRIERSDSIAILLEKASLACKSLVSQWAQLIVNGEAPHQLQHQQRASYCSKRSPEDGLINWNDSAESIERFVRAQTRPYPGAFSYLPNGHRVRIWQASVFPEPYYGVPGLVQQRINDGVVVCCGDGAVVVRECETDDDSRVHMPFSLLKWGMRLRTEQRDVQNR